MTCESGKLLRASETEPRRCSADDQGWPAGRIHTQTHNLLFPGPSTGSQQQISYKITRVLTSLAIPPGRNQRQLTSSFSRQNTELFATISPVLTSLMYITICVPTNILSLYLVTYTNKRVSVYKFSRVSWSPKQ